MWAPEEVPVETGYDKCIRTLLVAYHAYSLSLKFI